MAVGATDANGDILTYGLSGDGAANFTIDANGQITVATGATLDHETRPSYSLTATVHDGRDADGNADASEDDTITVIINVTDVDEDGKVEVSALQPQVGTALNATLTDPDGSITATTWVWARSADGSDASWTTISGATSTDTTSAYTPVDADVDNYLRATASYTDGEGSGKSAQAVSVNQVQAAPVINTSPAFPTAPATRSIAENAPAGAEIGAAVTATDGEDDTLTYSLSGTDQTSFDIVSTSGQITVGTGTSLDYETRNSYEVVVTAADPSGATDTIAVTINVTDVDEAPDISGQTSINYAENGTVSVATYTATDPEGVTPIRWTLAGNDEGDFSISTAGVLNFNPSPNFEDPQDANADNAYRVTVQASDGTVIGVLDVTINVTNVDEPPDISGQNSIDYAENGTVSVATYTATDPEGVTPIRWTLAGNDEGDFSISTAGVLNFNPSPNFEDPQDANADNAYQVTVQASDGIKGTALAVTINVTDVDEDGKVEVSALQPQVGTALNATLTDPDGTISATTWVWARSADGSDASWATISGATSTDTTSAYTPVDADVDNYLRATASYTDGEGSGKSAQAVSVNQVQAAPVINTAPAFPTATATRSIAENAPAGADIGAAVTATDGEDDTLTYSLSGTDAGSFDIVSTSGQITVGTGTSLDFESRNSYAVVVTAADPSGATDTIAVTINVTNVEEAGMVSLSPSQPQVGTALNATLTDPDGTISATTWVWASSSDWDATAETGTWSAITGADLESYTPVDADVGDYLRATASYTDGEGSGKSAQAVSVNQVQAAPVINIHPIFSDGTTTTRSVAENSPQRTNVGTAVSATDADTLTYSLSGTDAGSFDIVSTSGQITVGTGTSLDFESRNSYAVVVTAADPSGATDTIAVTIDVTDMDEPPPAPAAPTVSTASPTSLGVDWNAPDTTGIPAVDDYNVRYRVSDTADVWSTANVIVNVSDSSAIITVLAANTGYDVQVRAVNDEGESAWSEFASANTGNSVPEFDEGGSTSRSVPENTGSGTDIGAAVGATDTNGDTLTYTLGGADAASFTIVDTSGQLQTSAELNHEARSSYQITVTATDGKGGSDVITVTITVIDLAELPPAPAAPTVSRASAGSLAVDWNAPDTTGIPDITGYNVRYRVSGTVRRWRTANVIVNVSDSSAIITGLASAIGYVAQVQSVNADGVSAWSDSSASSPGIVGRWTYETIIDPIFLFVGKGTAATVTFRATFQADQRNLDSLSARLTDGATVTIGLDGATELTGWATSADTYDDSVSLATADVSFTPASGSACNVDLTKGSMVCEHRLSTSVIYAKSTATAGKHTVTTGLGTAFTYTAVVNTVDSTSSTPGNDDFPEAALTVLSESPPPSTIWDVYFESWPDLRGSLQRYYAGDYISVTVEFDRFVTITGAPQLALDIGENKRLADLGQFRDHHIFRGKEYTYTYFHYEVQPSDVDHDGVSVGADALSLNGGTIRGIIGGTDATLTIGAAKVITNDPDHRVDGTIAKPVAPEAPPEPSVMAAATNGYSTLRVEWERPRNQGPAVGRYVLRYRPVGETGWTTDNSQGTDPARLISGLQPGTTYEVQVRASNSIDPSPWSPSGTGTTLGVQYTPVATTSSQTTRGIPPQVPTTVVSPDGEVTLEFPQGARADARFQVRLDSADSNCGSTVGGKTAIKCVQVDLFDVDGNALDANPFAEARWAVQVGRSTGEISVYKRDGSGGGWVSVPSCDTSPDSECFSVDGDRVTVEKIAGFSQFAIARAPEQVVTPPPRPIPPIPPIRSGGGGGGGGVAAPAYLPPSFVDGSATTREVPENSPGGTRVGGPVAATESRGQQLTYRKSGVGGALFDVASQTGQIFVAAGAVLDYESGTRSYTFEVTAKAPFGPESKIPVTITVTNVDELGTVALDLAQPEVGAALSAALTDPDGGITGEVWRWQRSADGVSWTDIEGAVSAEYTPVESDAGMLLRVKVTYVDTLGSGLELVAVTPVAVPAAPAPTPEPTPPVTPALTEVPTPEPTPEPTSEPTPEPTAVAIPVPAAKPTATPMPTPLPKPLPTSAPTAMPTPLPTPVVTVRPTSTPVTASTAPSRTTAPQGAPTSTPVGTAAPAPEPTVTAAPPSQPASQVEGGSGGSSFLWWVAGVVVALAVAVSIAAALKVRRARARA